MPVGTRRVSFQEYGRISCVKVKRALARDEPRQAGARARQALWGLGLAQGEVRSRPQRRNNPIPEPMRARLSSTVPGGICWAETKGGKTTWAQKKGE